MYSSSVTTRPVEPVRARRPVEPVHRRLPTGGDVRTCWVPCDGEAPAASRGPEIAGPGRARHEIRNVAPTGCDVSKCRGRTNGGRIRKTTRTGRRRGGGEGEEGGGREADRDTGVRKADARQAGEGGRTTRTRTRIMRSRRSRRGEDQQEEQGDEDEHDEVEGEEEDEEEEEE